MGAVQGDLKKVDGDIWYAADVDALLNVDASNFNDNMQNVFALDYIGFDSRLAGGAGQQLKNVYYSTFKADDVDDVQNFIYDGTNDLYQTINWETIQSSPNYYSIDVYADSASFTSITGTEVIKISNGIWRIYSIDTSLDVARAKVVQNLFKPSSNSSGATAQIISNTTNITALKTSESGDIGYKFSYGYGSWNQDVDDSNAISSVTGTFSDTSNNLNSRAWGLTDGNSGVIGGWKKWGKFNGTGIDGNSGNSFVYAQSTGGNSNSFGTAVSQGVANNPTNVEAAVHHQNNSPGIDFGASALVMYKSGTISWVKVDGVNKTVNAFDLYDFDSNGVPSMTEQVDATLEGISTLIFKNITTETITNSVPVINSQIDVTSSEQISVSFDGGSNYEDVDNIKIVRPISGTELWRRIVITRTDLSKEDKVTEQAIKYNLY